MANYTKRLKGYVAPLLVLYTVLVTFFLAQTAWNDDVTTPPQKRSHVTFLDVLVQEEKRHIRSFQSIVENNRVVQSVKSRLNRHRRHRHNNSSDDATFGKLGAQLDPDYRALNRLLIQTNGSDPYNQVTSVFHDHDGALLHNDRRPDHDVKRPVYKVEVEEPDTPGVSRQSSGFKATGNSSNAVVVKKPPNKSLSMKIRRDKSPGTNLPQKIGVPPFEVTYSVEYCDKTFRDLSESSNLCNRNIVEIGTEDHVAISDYTLSFRPVGDIRIYSAFLDQRVSPPVVRLMVIAPQGRDGVKSVYWCMFYRTVPGGGANTRHGSRRMKQVKRASQLSYWAASDGHKAAQQFYIMSCTVPDEAMESLTSGHAGSMRLVVGGENDPLAGTIRENVTFRVINNANPDSGNGNSFHSRNKREYFHKMEEDLSKLTETIRVNSRDVNSDDEDIQNGVSSNSSNKVSAQPQNVAAVGGDGRGDTRQDASLNNGGPQAADELHDDKIVACVAPLQGSPGIIQIVEFIELTMLLGSQHVVFYTYRGDDEIANVLKMYEARGLVTVIDWRNPAPESLWARGRDVALNDCLYRTMHIYDYALFLDLDEFFVPRATPDMPSFLRYLRAVHKFNSTRFSDLVFSSAYFPPPLKPEYQNLTSAPGFTKDINKFSTLKSLRRSPYNTQHTLRMVKTTRAFRVGPGERRKSSFIINTRYASVHHYSHCPRDSGVGSQGKGAHLNVLTSGPPIRGGVNIPVRGDGITGGQKASIQPAMESSKAGGQVGNDMCSRRKIDWIMWRYRIKLIERTKESVRHFNRG